MLGAVDSRSPPGATMCPHTPVPEGEGPCPDCSTASQWSPTPVTVGVDAAGDRFVVSVRGELDMDSDPLLQQTLNKALDRAAGGLELDLAGVDFCDCSALNVLLDVRARAHLSGKQVVLTAASRAVQRLLTLTDTLPLFTQDRASLDGGAPLTQSARTTAPPAHPADERGDASTTDEARHHPSTEHTEHTEPSHDHLATE